nr:hypothetical protein CFP56_04103 [Quercus suber]
MSAPSRWCSFHESSIIDANSSSSPPALSLHVFWTLQNIWPHRLPLEGDLSLAPGVFRVRFDHFALALHLALLPHDPRLPTFPFRNILPSLALPPPCVQHVHVLHPVDRARDVAAADGQHEVQFDVLGVRVVLEDAGAEAGLDRGARDHVALLRVLGVELAHGLAAAPQRRVQPVEEALEPALGRDVGRLRVAEPLDRADGDRGVEGARAEGHALPDVGEQHVALDVALEGFAEHGRGDVHPDPGVRAAVVFGDAGQDLARQPGTAADVKDEGGVLQVEKIQGTVGHGGLNAPNARGGGVLAGFGVIVEQVRGKDILRAGHDGGSNPVQDEDRWEYLGFLREIRRNCVFPKYFLMCTCHSDISCCYR